MALNPAKLDNAIARVRRDGAIRPPITVRRARDGYLLVDGLYRLRGAGGGVGAGGGGGGGVTGMRSQALSHFLIVPQSCIVMPIRIAED